MAGKPNSVELIISARDESEKAFDEVINAIKEIEAAAKKGGGLTALFAGLEDRLESVAKKQRAVNEALGDTTKAQRGLKAASEFSKVLQEQERAAARAAQRLSQLEEEFAGVEEAANAARAPNERLQEALNKQRTRQGELADAIKQTAVALQSANAALEANAGLDERAANAVQKQKTAVIEAGQAWRTTTGLIAKANKELQTQTSQRDATQAMKAQADARVKQLQAEFKQLETLTKAFERQAAKEGAGGAVRAMASQARAQLNALRGELEQQKNIQTEFAKQLSNANREIKKQTTFLEKQTAKAAQQKQVYTDLKNSLAGFIEAQQAEGATRQSANIEKLQKSLAGLQAAYDETTRKAQSAEQALAASMAPDPRAIKQREVYQKRIGEALQAVQHERAELSRLQAELGKAGISTQTLTARQRELDQATERLTQEQAKLTAQTKALQKAKSGASGAAVTFGQVLAKVGRDTRQSLSYFQRLRGEFLSIAATYTGLYAVGGAVRSIYDASVLLNKAEARFSVAFGGDQKRVADEMKFVREEAGRLAIGYEQALDQYSKLVAGIPEGLLTLKEMRAVFTGFATSARVAGLSGEELERVFNAVSQIFSKQQVQLEELKGQLGDALPGAVQAAAKALGMDPQSLFKQIEQGNVSFEAAILLADQLAIQYGQALPKALESPAAAMDQFKNQWFDLRKELGDSGFIETLTKALREVTKQMQSPEFRKGAVQLAEGIGQLVEALVWAVQHFEELAVVLKIIAGLMVARTVYTYAERIFMLGTNVRSVGLEFAQAGSKLGRFITLLGSAIQLLPALFAGFAIGTWLNKEFAGVQKFGALMIGVFERIRIRVTSDWEKLVAIFEARIDDLEYKYKRAKEILDNPTSIFSGSEIEKPKGVFERFEEIEQRAAEARKNSADIIKQMWADIDKEFESRKNKGKESADAIVDLDELQKKVDAANALAEGLFNQEERDDLLKRALKNQGKEGQLTEKQLKALIERIKNSLNKIDAEIQEKTGITLRERLEAVRAEYAKLLKDIEKAGGSAAFPDAQSSIDQITAIKQLEETQKEINSLIRERRQLIQTTNEMQDLGAITVEEASKRINAENERILPRLNEALAVAREIADTVNSPVTTQAVDNQAQLVALEQERIKKEQLLALETQISREMDLRSARIQTINAEVEAGITSEYEGRQRVYQINKQTSDQIGELILKAREAALAMGDMAAAEQFSQMLIQLKKVNDQVIDIEAAKSIFASGFADAFDQFITGAQSAGDAFKQFAVDFLRQIAKMITQYLVLKAIQASFGGVSAGTTPTTPTVTPSVLHTGGIAGRNAVTRKVPAAAFASAMRYHTGGIAGLRADEVPAILQKGEEIVTENDPRHRNNGGLAGNQTPVQLKIVNAIDATSVLKEALNSAEGQRVFFNFYQANKSTFKSVQ